MFVGEGAEQLETHAREMERRAKGAWPKNGPAGKEYYRGLVAGLTMAARAARKEALKLRRARRKACASIAALDEGDED